jgi:pimeloyl-ACP methyl ester carboxylesterase
VPGPRVQCARTVDGLCIAYQVVGDGPFDLVYAPGWISNLECVWEMPDLGDFLRRLAGMARLILLDRRGTGLSDRPFTSESLSLEAGMDDVRAVMDAAGSERAVLFGVEDGAAVCSLYAASYPDRVRALVLFSVIAAHGWTEDFPWSWTDETYRAWVARVEHEWATEGFWSGVPNPVSPRLADDPDRVRAWARYARLSASPGTALALERAFYELDVRAVLPAIRVPTLVLHRIDNSFVAVGQARYASEHIPGARLVELPGDEHSPFMGNVGDRGWRTLLERHDATVRALLGRYRGTEVDTASDGFFARFDGPGRAIRCAQAIVEAVRPLGIELRAGVHTGEIELSDGKVGGIAVHIGARVGALAGPSEVLASSTVKDLTAGSGIAFEDAGEHELKGISERWRLFRVASPSA